MAGCSCSPGRIPLEYQYFSTESFKCSSCGKVFGDPEPWRKSIKEKLEWADIIVFQRSTDISHLKLMKLAREMGKKVIGESDDNSIDVPKTNPGFEYYKTRRGVVRNF